MVRPAVSVIIPTYNRAHLVGRAIRSVLAQTFPDWELLVVDDASTDNTEEVVRAFQDQRIHYLRHDENKGVSAARNTGIRAACGEYIGFLDSDDEWLPQKLEKQLRLFWGSKTELGAVGCGRLNYTRRGIREVLPTVSGWIYEDLLAGRARGTGTPLLLVRRFPSSPDVFFDEDFPAYEERDYLLRIARFHPIDFVREPLIRVYQDPNEPHVATPALVAKACSLYLKKYAPELDARPRVRSYYHMCIAEQLVRVGDARGVREHLLHAIRACPWNPKYWLLFFVSLLGATPFAMVNKVYTLVGRAKQRLLNLARSPVRWRKQSSKLRFLQ